MKKRTTFIDIPRRSRKASTDTLLHLSTGISVYFWNDSLSNGSQVPSPIWPVTVETSVCFLPFPGQLSTAGAAIRNTKVSGQEERKEAKATQVH